MPETVPRLRCVPVAPFFPKEGRLRVIVFGEAPGPRGADQSGVPFWGDGAGIPLYRALVRAGCANVAEGAWNVWDGALLRDAGIWPVLRGVALSNAYPCCPTDDGMRFRTPKKKELQSAENVTRLNLELERASELGARMAITFGRCAEQTVLPLARSRGWSVLALPHPSSQGLLMSAPGKGRGLKLADLRAAWEKRLEEALRAD